ncbi:putative membrane protein [Leptospira ryugenii]|uniref:Putative membrane protein n=2 Tax=Leptospira ryugenii TaxID=1917863 RepID=A0A2P2DYL7_9LEPT|nr:putative membrane protein [Leptospira ryugenii]
MFYGKGLLSDDGYDSQSMTGMRVAFFGAQAHFVYYFEPSYAWEAETGLTDKALASRSKKREGRVGHQNLGDLQTIREKKIHLVMDNRYPEANLPKIEYKFRENILRFYVNLYDPKLFDSLCQRTLWNCASLYDRMQRESLLPGREHQF